MDRHAAYAWHGLHLRLGPLRSPGVGQTPPRRGRVGETIRHGGDSPWPGHRTGPRPDQPFLFSVVGTGLRACPKGRFLVGLRYANPTYPPWVFLVISDSPPVILDAPLLSSPTLPCCHSRRSPLVILDAPLLSSSILSSSTLPSCHPRRSPPVILDIFNRGSRGFLF